MSVTVQSDHNLLVALAHLILDNPNTVLLRSANLSMSNKYDWLDSVDLQISIELKDYMDLIKELSKCQ